MLGGSGGSGVPGGAEAAAAVPVPIRTTRRSSAQSDHEPTKPPSQEVALIQPTVQVGHNSSDWERQLSSIYIKLRLTEKDEQ